MGASLNGPQPPIPIPPPILVLCLAGLFVCFVCLFACPPTHTRGMGFAVNNATCFEKLLMSKKTHVTQVRSSLAPRPRTRTSATTQLVRLGRRPAQGKGTRGNYKGSRRVASCATLHHPLPLPRLSFPPTCYHPPSLAESSPLLDDAAASDLR